jgi:hypothetical protein
MLLEHLLYNLSIAIIIGIIYIHYTKRNPTWIIFIAGCLPDIDYFFQCFTYTIRDIIIYIGYNGNIMVLKHGDFHNIFMIVVLSFGIGYLLWRWGFRFWDATICLMIGTSAHIIEDLIVYDYPYHLLLPFSNTSVNAINILNESTNMFGLGDWKIFIIGCLFVFVAYSIKILYDGKDIFNFYINYAKNVSARCVSFLFIMKEDE